ncbi:MAG TPA: plasmid partition protein ParG [Candidatus Rifleibacterium sp.]|nr:plasmid partition protein ParG [Candidatus Rifleibacterium sp.]
MKTLSFKIDDELHQSLKIGAAIEGRPIADVMKDLIKNWVKGRDPFIHKLKNMPVTSDEEELSKDDKDDVALALKEKNGGTWESLKAEISTKPGK